MSRTCSVRIHTYIHVYTYIYMHTHTHFRVCINVCIYCENIYIYICICPIRIFRYVCKYVRAKDFFPSVSISKHWSAAVIARTSIGIMTGDPGCRLVLESRDVHPVSGVQLPTLMPRPTAQNPSTPKPQTSQGWLGQRAAEVQSRVTSSRTGTTGTDVAWLDCTSCNPLPRC